MQNSEQLLEAQIQKHNLKSSLKSSLALAFERTGTEPFNIDNMISDILTEFPKLSNNDFTKAIRNGSLGKYGRAYRLNTTEVCYWIRQYYIKDVSKFVH